MFACEPGRSESDIHLHHLIGVVELMNEARQAIRVDRACYEHVPVILATLWSV